MVILAPFLIHLGALGRHPESNLFCFEAKMGSKRHLNGVSRKSFGEVFSPIVCKLFKCFFLFVFIAFANVVQHSLT